jgi:hypothetical protein
MKPLFVLCVVFILIGTASWAQNGFGTGGWLRDDWPAEQKFTDSEKIALSWAGSVKTMDSDELNRASTYEGFVLGAASVMQDFQWLDIPSTVSWGQQCTLVGKYLDAHPDQLNLRAEQLVYWALVAKWPGKRKP